MMMKKNWFSLSVLPSNCVALCLSATTAWAALTTFAIVATAPGVDVSGNLSTAVGLANVITVKITLNTNNGKTRGTGHGNVGNLSTRNQRYINPAFVGFGNSVYDVQKNGKCDLVVVN